MPADIEREIFECDVLIVGGGPSGMAAAIRLTDLVEAHNEMVGSGKKPGKKIADLNVMVIDKAETIGLHQLSGCVMDPIGISELIPDWLEKGAPVESAVKEDSLWYLTNGGHSFKFPITPPPFQNHGNYIISLGKMAKWLSEYAEAKGVNIFTGFPGVEPLLDGTTVTGVRTGDKGLDKHGKRKNNFEPGYDIQAKVTIFAEGTRGHLYRKLMEALHLDDGANPQIYAQGVKEVWELPKGRMEAGQVIHTMGFPLDMKTFGGSFIYSMANDFLAVGLVTGLDSADPFLDPHGKFQQLKTHPFVKKMLDGAKLISFGAKTIPEGGWFSCPKVAFDGGMFVGDSAGFVNVPRLKGVHYAMKSGMLAAESAYEALVKGDASEEVLGSYYHAVKRSYIGEDLIMQRNFRQPFDKGLAVGSVFAGMIEATKGMLPPGKFPTHNDGFATEPVAEFYGKASVHAEEPKYDGVLTFDRLTSAYYSGTKHDENSPCHLLVIEPDICSTRCAEEFQNPCQHFCPVKVYEMVDDEAHAGKKKLQINFTNCVHCKTCDIKDPYQIIRWVPPEGGGGPRYTNL